MTFRSTRVTDVSATGFTLAGDLTMHGVTKQVTLDVEGPSSPVKVRNSLRTGATATTTLNRFGFGLNWNRMVETGGLVVSEEVKRQHLRGEILRALRGVSPPGASVCPQHDLPARAG